MHFDFELELDRPRSRVWAAMDNPANLPKWQPTLLKYEPVSGTPRQPGAVAKLTYLENGREFEMIETVQERRELELMSGHYVSSRGTNTITNRLEDLPGGCTRWTVESDFRVKGFFPWLMTPLIRGAIQGIMQANVERFRQKLESGELE